MGGIIEHVLPLAVVDMALMMWQGRWYLYKGATRSGVTQHLLLLFDNPSRLLFLCRRYLLGDVDVQPLLIDIVPPPHILRRHKALNGFPSIPIFREPLSARTKLKASIFSCQVP